MRWVYARALSLAFGDTNLFVDNRLQISSYQYKESPIAIVSHYEHITFILQLVLQGVRTEPIMVEGKKNDKVTYVNSEIGFGSWQIVK